MVAEAPEAARDTTVEQDGTTPTVAGAERDTADLQSGMVAEAPEAASGDGEAEQQSEYGYNRARYEAEEVIELAMDSLGTNLSGLASMLTQTMRQDDKSPSRTAADKGGTPTPEPGKAEEIESTQAVGTTVEQDDTPTPTVAGAERDTADLQSDMVATSERDGTQAVGTTVEQDDTPTPTVAGAERDTADLQSDMVAEAPEAARDTTVEQDGTTPTVAGVAEGSRSTPTTAQPAEAIQKPTGATKQAKSGGMAGAPLQQTRSASSQPAAEQTQKEEFSAEIEGAAQELSDAINRARYEAGAAAELVMDSLGTNLSGLASMLTSTTQLSQQQDDKSLSRTAADKGGTPTPEPGKAEEIESTQVVQDALKKLKETATSFLHTSSKATSERDGTQAVGTTVEQDDTPTQR
ncbi:hypothetical protein GH714_042735 [Hevea brasiliensis]|uniref:Uncharacterized protein n=1 Tax=Hevea brasiliensis TaxID=3981 RepID=A0A6A6JZ94_HEVBR|nr:hypothetical protein GH714_042735 [Hevea brasiliensis]